MEKMNRKMPFEHQMMFIIKDYDRKVEEIHELRKELNELSQALEEFGGRKGLHGDLQGWCDPNDSA